MTVTLEKLIHDNLQTLDSADLLVKRLLEKAAQSGTTTQTLIAGIGPHLRHILDHYDAFLAGLDGGMIDYDQRNRCQQTELSPAFAQRRIRATVAKLRSIVASAAPERALQIRLCTDSECDGEITQSSVARELQFLQSHCVHHFAMMRRILGERGIVLDEDFGKAPATVSYERASAAKTA